MLYISCSVKYLSLRAQGAEGSYVSSIIAPYHSPDTGDSSTGRIIAGAGVTSG